MPNLDVLSDATNGQSGAASSFGSTDWAGTRNLDTGASPNFGIANSQYGAGIAQIAGTIVIIYRSVFCFDTSGITVAPTAVTLKIYTKTRNNGDVRAVKCTHFSDGAITNADFDAIPGFTDGASMSGNVTDYSAVVAEGNWAADGNINNISLNSTAMSDMASLDTFQVCIVNNTYDYLNVAPSGTITHAAGMYYSNNSGTSLDPFIEYTAGSSPGGKIILNAGHITLTAGKITL